MKLLNKNSLWLTLDNVNQALFNDVKINLSEKTEIAKWISGRQGLPGSYWYMFGPTPYDFKGIKLFTGDEITSRAGIGHILGEEACTVLHKLNVKSSYTALERAEDGLTKALKNAKNRGHDSYGWYCCGRCTAVYWRNLSAEGADKNKKLLIAGIKKVIEVFK